ncbi:MAG: hypothetical protein COX30_03345 [Candidatus Moranbacteria bacterium CG23_combo_of_CG06-09_8_20_14_all_39_10]|nr:MAG: hypothetical protein COX30_03345 [Candidatus Moranbacteria bacterium CG23_combo_of_CG06-09_8_20_14_all_39_10]
MGNKANFTDFLAKCAVCEGSLDLANVIVLEEKEQKTTVHVTCPQCNSAAIVFLSNNQTGMVSVGIATDLDGAEVKKLFGSEVISADEIIDLHEFVSSEQGDIMQLIK